MRTHRTYEIMITLKDDCIEPTSCSLRIETREKLSTVLDKLNTAFKFFDRNIGYAKSCREDYGWGVDAFVEYLDHRYKRSWCLVERVPDASIVFIGM